VKNNLNRWLICFLNTKYLRNYSYTSYPEKSKITKVNFLIKGAKGGVAILVSNKTKHELLPSTDNSLLELFGIEVPSEAPPKTFHSVHLPGLAFYQDILSFYASDLRNMYNNRGSFFSLWRFQLKTSPFVELMCRFK
jgi:hypothetical protein